MQFETKLTLHGLMTLIAGIIAFAAVIMQVRSSSKQVRDQIKAQRDAEHDEQKRQKLAVAKALLTEIDHFVLFHVRPLINKEPGREFVKFLDDTPFTVFQANAYRLGEMESETARTVVHFYGLASEHVASLRRNVQICEQPSTEGESKDQKANRETKFFRAIVDRLETVQKAAVDAMSSLSKQAESS
jgi:hypothetical protein